MVKGNIYIYILDINELITGDKTILMLICKTKNDSVFSDVMTRISKAKHKLELDIHNKKGKTTILYAAKHVNYQE